MKCDLCGFWVPHDWIGVEIMKAHFGEVHPEHELPDSETT